MTPEQKKRRAQMLDAHYNEHETHDYKSPKEWQKQIFRLHIKKTLFDIALNIITVASICAAIYVLIKYK